MSDDEVRDLEREVAAHYPAIARWINARLRAVDDARVVHDLVGRLVCYADAHTYTALGPLPDGLDEIERLSTGGQEPWCWPLNHFAARIVAVYVIADHNTSRLCFALVPPDGDGKISECIAGETRLIEREHEQAWIAQHARWKAKQRAMKEAAT